MSQCNSVTAVEYEIVAPDSELDTLVLLIHKNFLMTVMAMSTMIMHMRTTVQQLRQGLGGLVLAGSVVDLASLKCLRESQ